MQAGPNFLASVFGEIIQPLALLWLMCLLMTYRAFRQKQWGSAISLALFSLIFFVVGATPVPTLLVERLEAPYVGQSWQTIPEADAIIILGGSIGRSKDDLIGFNAKREVDRIITGFELARRGKAKALIFGGGIGTRGNDVPTEGEIMKDWYGWSGGSLPTIVLPPSINTHDEARSTQSIMEQNQWTKALLVTSANHMTRAAATFRTAGVEVIPVACDFEASSYRLRTGAWSFVPKETSFYLMSAYLHEIVGWTYYQLRGRIKDSRRFIG